MKKKVHAAIDSFLERRSDVVITPAGHVRRHLIDHEGVSPEKIIVVHYGIDVDSFRRSEEARRRLRAEFGFTDAFVVGTVASFQPIKGHIYLLEAIAQVARQIPNVRLLLIGTGDRRAVDEAIARLGIQKYVVFAGFRRDVADCLSAMDMMVHPSLTEALCQAVLEGMSAELPVVGADIPFTREVIEPGVNGLIVASCNSSAIAEAILQLHADPPLRNRLAEAARQTPVSGFTIEQMVQGHLDCYRRVMGSDVAGLASMERHDR
jgi:glycosyltransferase involved in cell wall biosynthesis